MEESPGLLTIQEFMLLQGLLGSGYYGLELLQGSLESGLEVVAFSRNVTVERDMLYQFNENANNVNALATVDLMSLATRSLIDHVQNRSGQTLNDYLFVRGIKVTRYFAMLTSGLGYPIYPVNIES